MIKYWRASNIRRAHSTSWVIGAPARVYPVIQRRVYQPNTSPMPEQTGTTLAAEEDSESHIKIEARYAAVRESGPPPPTALRALVRTPRPSTASRDEVLVSRRLTGSACRPLPHE
jgi:hypothetical protein